METTLLPVAENLTAPIVKTIRIAYWSLTGLFALAMLMDGIAGTVQEETGQEVMRHLGYPMYLLTICGIAKILGVAALLQTRFQTIKEWAYAGFTINFIGAFASRAFVGDQAGLLIPPLVMLAVLFLTYFVWKRYSQSNAKYTD
ncbi:DoxX family protein [Fibrisoma montanum]|uniref:DoxX family protein n=1 Tax=Fibrisoma montanum TaxID=2305895 RepID=A0A418MBF8_9BACT|nr:DoxX family protein [Fibrisoma montanum]RIV23705.1 DoxX family protein [Fibrisoma montanum]